MTRFSSVRKLLIFLVVAAIFLVPASTDMAWASDMRLHRRAAPEQAASPPEQAVDARLPSGSARPLASDKRFDGLEKESVDLPNLGVVAPGLLRGGQPTSRGLALLKQAGVKTVVNLRTEDIPVDKECALVKQMGMNFVHLPMYIFEKPDKKLFLRFLGEVASSDNQPVFVHCQYGRDRTGTVIGAYRIAVERWTFDQAFDEMMKFGFRPGVATLTNGLHDFARDNGDRSSALPSPGFIYSDMKNRFNAWRHNSSSGLSK